MDTTTHHTMQALFDQLGLPSGDADIQAFVRRHRPLQSHLRLWEAPFWNESQASFLREQLRVDDDWAVLIDTLNAQLRADPAPHDGPRAAAADHPNEGEGNVTAARRYNAAVQRHASTVDTARAAREAAPADEREAQALRQAEEAGAAKARH